MAGYPFESIEPKWQEFWDENKTFKTEINYDKPKYYVLDMFPYPSGTGLHIGHPEGYTATDIVARYKKMKGFNVLHPMGFDAFGLPTERYSMKTGIHPEIATAKNIENFTRQLKSIGFSYDWDNIVNTTDPEYYKWTQWMFLTIYNSYYDKEEQTAKNIDELPIPSELKNELEIQEYQDKFRLAYIAMIPVNWCEALGTVLANEEIDEWKQKGYEVERRPMRQWMLRITEYADRLLDDLDLVKWPISTMDMQKNWIGKSEGAEVDFQIDGIVEKLRIYTTRPDTIFGATYMVIAPEHQLVNKLITNENSERANEYIKQAAFKSDLERSELNKDKTGVFTGSFAINPANNAKIPILISDYVLVSYGTGAIMAVPAHDQRDYEFAKEFKLKILPVVSKDFKVETNIDNEAFTEYGYAINSETCDFSIDGLHTNEAKPKVIDWLEENNLGKRKVQFRLRDWLFSRQRYWGEPIPIMFFEDGTRRALNEDELPLVLPDVQDYKPAGTGESPLANVESWVNFIDLETGKKAKFETNTMPQWAGSCWYYLRYTDTKNSEVFASNENESYWMGDSGVDLYIGGAEHAVLHLLYARFWHKVLFDFGFVSTPEPFSELFHQGLILREDGKKMSKSEGKSVNPDDVIKENGADALRLYEMFLGPLEAAKPWNTNGIEGINRFLARVWRLFIDENDGNYKLSKNISDDTANKEQEFILHSTIKKVGQDIENLSFNTAISQMMIFVNEMYKFETRPKSVLLDFIKLLSPFAPHICEEIWYYLGNKTTIAFEVFPSFDEDKTIKKDIEFVLQVNGKVRAKMQVDLDIEEALIKDIALKNENIIKFMEGKEAKKIIFVKNKLLNIIV